MIKYLAIIFLFAGCTQLQSKTTETGPLYKYKADIAITINDKNFDGMALVDMQRNQTIKIVSKAKLDVLIVSSCQRFETYEKLDKNWYGGVGKEFKYEYRPTQSEFDENCPLYFQAFDKSGLTAWAYVAFRSDQGLMAKVECNGKTIESLGFTLCQTKNGFEQTLSFLTPIKYFKAGDLCKVTKINDFFFKVEPLVGFCNATFSDGKAFHQLTLLGYEQALIRGE